MRKGINLGLTPPLQHQPTPKPKLPCSSWEMCVAVSGVHLFFTFLRTVHPCWLGLWMNFTQFWFSLIAARVKEPVFLSTHNIALLAKVKVYLESNKKWKLNMLVLF